MTTERKLAEAVHALTLAVWLGSLVMAAIVVARVFPMMREFGPVLESFQGYPSEHHPVIVGGHVGEHVFTSLAVIQFFGVLFTAGSLVLGIWLWGIPLRRVSTLLRASGLGLAVMCVSGQLFWLDPMMNAELRAFWEQARLGEVERADRHREAFNALHPTASNLLAGSFLGVATAVVAQVFSLAQGGASAPGRRDRGSAPQGQPELEEPRLSTSVGGGAV